LQNRLFVALLYWFVDLEDDDHSLVATEDRNDASAGGLIAILGVKLVVLVGVESAEMVLTVIVRDLRSHVCERTF
jgi:hypothetical protein